MKRIFFLLVFLSTGFFAEAQFGDMLDKAKKKAEEKANKTVDDATKKKTEGTAEENKTSDESASDKPDESKPAGMKVYSKFDFVPGEKVVVMEDFMQDAVGDFPDKWNTNSSAEVVTIDGSTGHWLMFPKPGVFMPDFIDTLPDNFTLEFDLFSIHGNKTGSWPSFHTVLVELSNRDQPQNWQLASNNYYFSVYAGNSTDGSTNSSRRKNGTVEAGVQLYTKQFGDKTKPVHISMWRQKERLRIYFNEEKVWDVPKALVAGIKYNSILFYLPSIDEANIYCVSNLRLAVGAPDTRNKLLTEGKWVTHGILFDVNSANIKAESFGTLKEISGVLKENTDVKVKIIGHTDADGDDKSNLELSKRRAASVKEMLTKEFGIEESRMETDGLGESKPVDKNATPEGKVNNRRVEFLKM